MREWGVVMEEVGDGCGCFCGRSGEGPGVRRDFGVRLVALQWKVGGSVANDLELFGRDRLVSDFCGRAMTW